MNREGEEISGIKLASITSKDESVIVSEFFVCTYLKHFIPRELFLSIRVLLSTTFRRDRSYSKQI